ncbi:MAG: DUF4351 domain-containing protein [Blastocatellia bacterium]
MPIPDYDTPWKDILDRLLPQFMAFFFPDAHRQIDWRRGYELLDKELQKITADAAIGRRAVDKLVKVWLKTGKQAWVLIHIEVQGRREAKFDWRVFIYQSRIINRFNLPVATFVVLTDEHPNWRPSEFHYELLGTESILRFSAAKLLDYRQKWGELEKSDNPFAIVVMAHLRAIETRRDPRRRLNWKVTLTRMLYRRGYSKRDVVDLMRFLDWVMALPEDLQGKYRQEVERIEEENRMPYISTFERKGIEMKLQGLQEGRLDGSAGIVLRQLRGLFGEIDEERIRTLPLKKIEKLGDALIKFDSIEDLKSWLRKNAPAKRRRTQKTAANGN